MDIDRYIHRHEPTWQALADATRRARRVRGMTPAEVDDFVHLYRTTATQLSYVRSHYADPGLVDRLTRQVAEARAVLYGTRSRSLRGVADFFARGFPRAVWESRWYVLAATLLLVVPAAVWGVWFANSEVALDTEFPDAAREALVTNDFEAYYSSAPAAAFSTQVLVNNILVSFQAFAGGITGGIWTVYVLVVNGTRIGAFAGLFHSVGEAPKFWGLILPHGLIEITAVVVAGGAGLRLGWSIVDPGDRSRGRAFAEEGRASVTIVLGLVFVFTLAGLIEGYVTPSDLPTSMRVTIGVVVWLAFCAYVVVQGRPRPESTVDAPTSLDTPAGRRIG